MSNIPFTKTRGQCIIVSQNLKPVFNASSVVFYNIKMAADVRGDRVNIIFISFHSDLTNIKK